MQRACGQVRVVDDKVVEEDEVVAFNISSTAGEGEGGRVMYLVGERAQVVMKIRDDDREWLWYTHTHTHTHTHTDTHTHRHTQTHTHTRTCTHARTHTCTALPCLSP